MLAAGVSLALFFHLYVSIDAYFVTTIFKVAFNFV